MAIQSGLKVRKTMCKSCVYKPDSKLDPTVLEDAIRDAHGFMQGYRICHNHSGEDGACCRGFWEKNKDATKVTQIAQRLGLVEFSNENELGDWGGVVETMEDA